MLGFTDETEAIAGAKTARMEQWTKPTKALQDAMNLHRQMVVDDD